LMVSRADWVVAGQRKGVPDDLMLAIVPPLLPTLVIVAILSFSWLTADSRAPARVIFRRKLLGSVIILGLGLGICALIGDVRLNVHPTRALWLAMSMTPSFLLLAAVFAVAGLERRDAAAISWSRQPFLHGPRVIEVVEAGLHETTEKIDCVYRWPCFRVCRETENLYVLALTDERFYMLPKRCLDIQQDELFRRLIRRFIADVRFRPRDVAFAVIVGQAPERGVN